MSTEHAGDDVSWPRMDARRPAVLVCFFRSVPSGCGWNYEVIASGGGSDHFRIPLMRYRVVGVLRAPGGVCGEYRDIAFSDHSFRDGIAVCEVSNVGKGVF